MRRSAWIAYQRLMRITARDRIETRDGRVIWVEAFPLGTPGRRSGRAVQGRPEHVQEDRPAGTARDGRGTMF